MSRIVLKVGGAVAGEAATLALALAQSHEVCVVHGAGPQISAELERGVPLGAEPDVSNGSCRIELDLGLGAGSASYLTSDLSYDYVRINADYRT